RRGRAVPARPRRERLAQQLLRDLFPKRRAERERLLVDALVVAVEHRRVVLEGEALAEQPEAVADRARPAEEAVVGTADHHERNERGAVDESTADRRERVPQGRDDGR